MKMEDIAAASKLAAERQKLEKMRQDVNRVATIGEVVGYDREDASIAFSDRQHFDLREINPDDKALGLKAGVLIKQVLMDAIDARHAEVTRLLRLLGVTD